MSPSLRASDWRVHGVKGGVDGYQGVATLVSSTYISRTIYKTENFVAVAVSAGQEEIVIFNAYIPPTEY